MTGGRKCHLNDMGSLRKDLFWPSFKGIVTALNRLADLIALGGHDLDVSMVSPRRAIGLGTYGLSSKAPLRWRFIDDKPTALVRAIARYGRNGILPSPHNRRRVHCLPTPGNQRHRSERVSVAAVPPPYPVLLFTPAKDLHLR